MAAQTVQADDQYVLNQCTKYLARDSADPRHGFGQYGAGDGRAAICEAWRFPIIDSHWDGNSAETSYGFNNVTFVYRGARAGLRGPNAVEVALVGTFAPLYETIPLHPLTFMGEPTGLFAVTVKAPKAQVHRYKFVADGRPELDPINPQRETLDNGQEWSRFFTEACTIPLTFNRFEREVLQRLVSHLLPFRLEENRRFIRSVYDTMDRAQREEVFPLAYLLDEDVGVVNYIDKVVSREEQHNADDYRTCLKMIGDIVRARMSGANPLTAPPKQYVDLYQQMEQDNVDGWDRSQYASPRYFLLMLRRHAMTGAFVHPRRGGNSAAAGWMYLESRFKDADGNTLFDWRRSIEAPLGHNTDYRG